MVPLLSWTSVAIALVVSVCPGPAIPEGERLNVVVLVMDVSVGVLGCAVDDAVHFILRLGSNCADCDLFDILGFDDAVGFFLGACAHGSPFGACGCGALVVRSVSMFACVRPN